MGKRKSTKGSGATNGKGNESGSEDDFDLLNVEFEWFDPQPAYDFQGIKVLLQQLFDVDSQHFDLSKLADLVLAQPLLGSTVKVDGNDTDPYAFLSVLNLREHETKPFVATVVNYLREKAVSVAELGPVGQLLAQTDQATVGLILTDRLINVPSEVVPPMYTMLLEEVQWALEEKEPYQFSHYLILSRKYVEIASKLDEENERPRKKKKAISEAKSGSFFYFHPEDEVFERNSIAHGTYDFTTQQDEGHSDSKRAFQEMGIKPVGHMILIDAKKFEDTVKQVAEYLKPPG